MNKTIIAISWRNVWRNKLRSIIIICAVSVGLIGGLFYYGFALGMMNQRVESAIRNEISNLQIHHPEYLLNEEVKNNIQDPNNTSQLILKYPEVKAVSQRIKATAMISTAETGTGVILNGVIPNHEKQVTGLAECIDKGEFLNNESRIPIIIGSCWTDNTVGPKWENRGNQLRRSNGSEACFSNTTVISVVAI